MKNKEFKEILKKCFGKEKDDRYHSIAMLIIYGIFIFIVVLIIRLSGTATSTLENQPTQTPNPTPPIVTPDYNDNPEPLPEDKKEEIVGNDINYSYSYTITINGETEVYLGKKIDDKEKFTLIKNGKTTDYAILNDNYLKLENGIYHITENPSDFFKYCDVEKILSLVDDIDSLETNNKLEYSISNADIAYVFRDRISVDNNKTNKVELTVSNNSLKSIDFNLNNYLTSVKGEETALSIHMEFADIGTTEDFEIKVS